MRRQTSTFFMRYSVLRTKETMVMLEVQLTAVWTTYRDIWPRDGMVDERDGWIRHLPSDGVSFPLEHIQLYYIRSIEPSCAESFLAMFVLDIDPPARILPSLSMQWWGIGSSSSFRSKSYISSLRDAKLAHERSVRKENRLNASSREQMHHIRSFTVLSDITTNCKWTHRQHHRNARAIYNYTYVYMPTTCYRRQPTARQRTLLNSEWCQNELVTGHEDVALKKYVKLWYDAHNRQERRQRRTTVHMHI